MQVEYKRLPGWCAVDSIFIALTVFGAALGLVGGIGDLVDPGTVGLTGTRAPSVIIGVCLGAGFAYWAFVITRAAIVDRTTVDDAGLRLRAGDWGETRTMDIPWSTVASITVRRSAQNSPYAVTVNLTTGAYVKLPCTRRVRKAPADAIAAELNAFASAKGHEVPVTPRRG